MAPSPARHRRANPGVPGVPAAGPSGDRARSRPRASRPVDVFVVLVSPEAREAFAGTRPRRLDVRGQALRVGLSLPNELFILGWRPVGSAKRRWRVEDCIDAAAAARIAAGLARLDGGGLWRVYGTASVVVPDGSVRVERRDVPTEGVVLPAAS